MASGNRKNVELWNVKDHKSNIVGARKVVSKVTVRGADGRFHGATNFKSNLESR